jgi:prepilin-type N-terminal cleavage/methylation domain-containing protein
MLALLRSENGFTLIELIFASIILLIVSAPITAIVLTSSELARTSLQRTSVDKVAGAKIELIEAMPYDNIGLSGGNPSGTITSTSPSLLYTPTKINGTPITISYTFSYINDHGAKTVTYGDYKQVVVTIKNTTTGAVLSTKTADIASLAGAADGGADYVDIRRNVVDMAAGSPALSGVTMNLTGGPSAPRSDTSNSSGSVIFPELTANTSSTNFYDIATSLTGYSTYPGDLPYPGTGSPAISLEQVNHQTGADDLQTIHMYKNGISATVNIYKSNGTTVWPSASTVYMNANSGSNVTDGIAGTTASVAANSFANINTLSLDNSYISPAVTTINVFPANYEISAESGTASSMTYATPQTVAVPSNYPTTLTQTVNLVMGASPCTSNTTLTVTVKRGSSTVQGAHVEVYSTATGQTNAPSVWLWGDTNSSGQVSLIIPTNTSGKSYTIKATDARGSTYTATSQSFTSSTGSATLTITP